MPSACLKNEKATANLVKEVIRTKIAIRNCYLLVQLVYYEFHFGEEPSFSGTRVRHYFFQRLFQLLLFLQNYQISQEGLGNECGADELVELCLQLVDKGVHNLNFVTRIISWPHVDCVCHTLRERDVTPSVSF